MGQKVSPVGLRIGINKDWESKWYAPSKDFSKYLNTDIKIRKYLLMFFKNIPVFKNSNKNATLINYSTTLLIDKKQ